MKRIGIFAFRKYVNSVMITTFKSRFQAREKKIEFANKKRKTEVMALWFVFFMTFCRFFCQHCQNQNKCC